MSLLAHWPDNSAGPESALGGQLDYITTHLQFCYSFKITPSIMQSLQRFCPAA
jgi:hypothetical protein